jgi:predicted nucleotidyltransferase
MATMTATGIKRRDEVLRILRQHEDDLRQRHVRSLAVFGSVTRDEAGPESDVDLLVEFGRPVGLFHMAGLMLYLEEILGCPVDLVTQGGLKPRIRERVIAEAVHVV